LRFLYLIRREWEAKLSEAGRGKHGQEERNIYFGIGIFPKTLDWTCIFS